MATILLVSEALCLFSFEVLEALQQEGHTVHAGASGENLTVAGPNWKQPKPGDHMRIGEEVQIKLTSYSKPCRHNAHWMVNGDFSLISPTGSTPDGADCLLVCCPKDVYGKVMGCGS